MNTKLDLTLATAGGNMVELSEYGEKFMREEAERRTFCVWRDDDGEGNWATQCHNIFTITDGTPKDNEMTYCCYCGKTLKEGDI